MYYSKSLYMTEKQPRPLHKYSVTIYTFFQWVINFQKSLDTSVINSSFSYLVSPNLAVTDQNIPDSLVKFLTGKKTSSFSVLVGTLQTVQTYIMERSSVSISLLKKHLAPVAIDKKSSFTDKSCVSSFLIIAYQ